MDSVPTMALAINSTHTENREYQEWGLGTFLGSANWPPISQWSGP